MVTYMEFRKAALTPAFRMLRQHGIHASTWRNVCCKSCGHAELGDLHPSYVFYVLPFVPVSKLYLDHHFESDATQELTLSVLRHFCDVEWDGDRSKCIIVRPKPPPHWATVRRWVRTHAIAMYWFALTSHLYAPGGVGCKRDRMNFERDMGIEALTSAQKAVRGA